jgi:ferritin-like metal-binding protein YciE
MATSNKSTGTRKGDDAPTRSTSSVNTLEDLFYTSLRLMIGAERKIMKDIKLMTKDMSDEDLVKAFEVHAEETNQQIENLEKCCELMDRGARAMNDPAIDGLLEAGRDLIEACGPDVKDAVIIACAQNIEHFEITRYGTLKAWAVELGLDECADLLEANLQQEKDTDALLTQVATDRANRAAA